MRPKSYHQTGTGVGYTHYTKTGTHQIQKNYRPIALLSVLYKTLARMINKRLKTTLEKEKLINESQTGFRTKRATEINTMLLFELIDTANKQNRKINIAFVDVTGAYDSVNRDALAFIMEKMNIHPKLRCLVKQTLTNTSFKVITKYGLTEEIKTTRGLKQGDPLSPTLFNIFINPILDYLNETGKGFRLWGKEIKVLAFADDIALISETKEGVVDMLDKLSECLDEFGMKINNTKSALCSNDRDLTNSISKLTGSKYDIPVKDPMKHTNT